ncbi:MAG TPA: 2'-5' RNA ligase family protein [Frankiaceae bacterium]|nr:2'-5' RNA ligase family protein [Frankiaceae bacterium]
MPPPLIVTLDVDAATQEFFDRQRRRHFPPDRNVLGAHVTLFHALPGTRERRVRAVLRELTDRPGFALQVTGVRSLGRGAAYDLAAPEAGRLWDDIADRFRSELTRQDAQRLRPHVTVANKLSAEAARGVFTELANEFAPFEARATGLSLYRYLGGPWELVESFRFRLR